MPEWTTTRSSGRYADARAAEAFGCSRSISTSSHLWSNWMTKDRGLYDPKRPSSTSPMDSVGHARSGDGSRADSRAGNHIHTLRMVPKRFTDGDATPLATRRKAAQWPRMVDIAPRYGHSEKTFPDLTLDRWATWRFAGSSTSPPSSSMC